MSVSAIQIAATVIFACALIHTFSASYFQQRASRYPEGSVGENLFHLLGEVEVVFGLWAGVLIVVMSLIESYAEAVHYTESLNFTEPLFVFAIMTIAATKPVVQFAQHAMVRLAHHLPLHQPLAMYLICLIAGPLLGSFITEPAAMTVTALILREQFFRRQVSTRFMYITLAILFVNISIGGVLTPYAAPPVLMVAAKWNWHLGFMMQTFGLKSVLAVTLNTVFAMLFLRKELLALPHLPSNEQTNRIPLWLTLSHVFFLVMVVINAHHSAVFMGLLLFFIGLCTVTAEYQEPLKIRQSLLVAFFLAGLVTLGGLQRWWLEVVLLHLNAFSLYVGATGLTAITDNAALTYLGSQVEGVSDIFKYALVAGAVSGGGLTVIANAPNPAGYSILNEHFGPGGISAAKLFKYALLPTLLVMLIFWGLHV